MYQYIYKPIILGADYADKRRIGIDIYPQNPCNPRLKKTDTHFDTPSSTNQQEVKPRIHGLYLLSFIPPAIAGDCILHFQPRMPCTSEQWKQNENTKHFVRPYTARRLQIVTVPTCQV